MKITATIDRRLIPSHRSCHRFVKLAIQAPEVAVTGQRPPVNIAFVLDRSGSMGGGKFELAQQAVRQAITRLEGRDRFSLVVFDQQVELVHPSEPATPRAKQRALDALSHYGPRGTTNLGEGWLMGCGQVAEYLSEASVGRCMLLTDGQANVGIVDTTTLCHHATELKSRGVSTSTFGVGHDFEEHLLGGMADAGGGAFKYIEHAEQIPALMDQELGETLEVVARRVVLEIDLPAGVTVSAVGPYTVELGNGVARVHLPDLVSGQLLDFPLKLGFPKGHKGDSLQVGFRVVSRDGVLDGLVALVEVRYAARDDNRAQARDVEVDRFVAQRYAARAMQDASRLNRDGDFTRAAHALRSVARRIRRYADDDPELLQTSVSLAEEAEAYKVRVSVSKRKADYARSQATASSMGVSGKRQRWSGQS
jgi:Ca-activated chloride channel family protein